MYKDGLSQIFLKAYRVEKTAGRKHLFVPGYETWRQRIKTLAVSKRHYYFSYHEHKDNQ